MPERSRAQVGAALAPHQAQLQQQKAQNDAIHLQVKTQGEIGFAKIKAALDAKMSVLETHLKAAIEKGESAEVISAGRTQGERWPPLSAGPNRPGKYLLVVHHG